VTAATAVVPSGYQELAERYGDDLRRAVRRCLPWVRPEEREDVLQYILQQFLIRDVIRMYKPGFVTDRAPNGVTFRSFILGQVPAYCRGKGEALARNSRREMCTADAPVGDGHATWIEQVTKGDGRDEYPSLADEDLLARLRRHLADRPGSGDGPSPAELLDHLAARAEEGKDPERGLARHFGLDEATAAARLAGLRAELHAAVSRRHPEASAEVGGVMLSLSQVRSAAALLREAAGNQVLKVWQKAGHPLAEAGKDWYVPWAKQELAWYPHLRGEKGGHFEGGHGSPVKRGLIHRLERLLTGEEPSAPKPLLAPAAEPETWLDRAEAALWSAPGATLETVESALELVRTMFGGSALWASGCISSSATG
jgi:hypothetical protein